MARLLSIDYGKARTGLAHTDPLQLIASALTTVATPELFSFLETYLAEEEVEALVVGLPLRAHGVPGEIEEDIQGFVKKFHEKYPFIPVHRQDESYTSLRAAEIIFQSGMKKKKRRDKKVIDRVSATLILQAYMDQR